MESIDRQQIQLLVEIQNVGTKMDIVRAKLTDAPKKLAAFDLELEKSATVLEEMESSLQESKKKYRDFDGEVQSEHNRAKKNEEKLRSVKNNKDYQAMLKEISNIKKKVSGMEDEMLAMLDEQEALESEITEKKKEYEALADRVSRDKALVESQAEAMQMQADELEAKMEEFGASVDASLLDRYEWVRGRVGRNAVVSVVNAVCQGCHLNIPPQMYNELQRADRLEFCPHCKRIIYWNDGSERSGRSPNSPQGDSEESPNTEGQGAP